MQHETCKVASSQVNAVSKKYNICLQMQSSGGIKLQKMEIINVEVP